MKDLEENGLYKGRQQPSEDKDVNWENPREFLQEFFKRFSEKRKRSEKEFDEDESPEWNEYTDDQCRKYIEELKLLKEYNDR